MNRSIRHTIRRNGTYHYKRRIPQHALGHAHFGGSQFYQRSLGTSDYHEALGRVLELDVEFSLLIGESETRAPSNEVSAQNGQLSFDQLMYLARRHRDAIVGNDARMRREAGRDGKESLTAQRLSELDEVPMELADHFEKLRGFDPSAVEEVALGTLHALGIAEPKRHASWNDLCDALLQAEIDAYQSIHQSHIARRMLEPEPLNPRLQTAPKEDPTKHVVLLSDLADEYMRVSNPGPSWRVKVSAAIDSYSGVAGTSQVAEITQRSIQDWVSWLLDPPIDSTAARSVTHTPKPPRKRAPRTVRDGYLAVIKTLLKFAVDRGYISSSPASGVTVPTARRKATAKRPFDVSELESIFQLPRFVGSRDKHRIDAPGSVLIDDHRYWNPLLALFTGARSSEIAQLRLRHVTRDGEYDVLLFTTSAGDQGDEDSLKTPSAFRRVPIHPELIKLGFLAYVEGLRDAGAGEERLFPDWKLRGFSYSDSSCQRTFNKRLKEMSVRRPDPSFHSFRHTFKTHAANSGMAPQAQAQILGHAQHGMDSIYLGALTVGRLVVEMNKYAVEGLDLSHLYPDNRRRLIKQKDRK